MAEQISVTVDISDALDGLYTLSDELSAAGRRLIEKIVNKVERRAKSIMLEVYDNAVASTGGRFPDAYAVHLRQGIQRLGMVVEVFDTDIAVSFEDIEELGGWEDILAAVHYHAILNDKFDFHNPPLSDMGTSIDDLYGPNKPDEGSGDNRQDFWDHLIIGAPYTAYFGKARIPHTFSTEGEYEETLNARVAYWGTRYPEWIILDEGLDGIPGSPPTQFVSLIGPAIEEYILTLIEPEIIPTYDEAIETWNTPRFRDLGRYTTATFDPRIGSKGGYRAPSGRFVKKL